MTVSADLFFCLARAFALPKPGDLALLQEALAADLAELLPPKVAEIDQHLAAYRAAIAAIADDEALLVLYSRLFLTPGAPHPQLNMGLYLDGGILGGQSTLELRSCYHNCGLEPNGSVGELPDHLMTQLEFVGWLYAQEASGKTTPQVPADEFLRYFIARWIGPFCADLEAANARFAIADNPYLHLARLLQQAIAQHLMT